MLDVKKCILSIFYGWVRPFQKYYAAKISEIVHMSHDNLIRIGVFLIPLMERKLFCIGAVHKRPISRSHIADVTRLTRNFPLKFPHFSLSIWIPKNVFSFKLIIASFSNKTRLISSLNETMLVFCRHIKCKKIDFASFFIVVHFATDLFISSTESLIC